MDPVQLMKSSFPKKRPVRENVLISDFEVHQLPSMEMSDTSWACMFQSVHV